jgi:hypothetical protein
MSRCDRTDRQTSQPNRNWAAAKGPALSVLSIDLAHKSYADVGVCSLRIAASQIEVAPIRLPALGLSGKPMSSALARVIADLAEQLGARLILIDGPQAWKSPENGLSHSRICERQLATQGKTGLPGFTKPSNYAPFIALAIDLFDQLAELGWPRLPDESALASSSRFALESFPTYAWRSLGLKPLPGKANTPAGVVPEKLTELSRLYPISTPSSGELTHHELQALVAGLAGIAVEGHAAFAFNVVGVSPFQLEGSWREGFIVNPVRGAAVQQGNGAEVRQSL